MNENTKAEPIPAPAEHWARKGQTEIEKMDATITLARQFMVGGEVQPYAEEENPFELPPYPWEVSEVRAEDPRRIYLGTVSDLATGTGNTIHFAAGLARGEDEFRRQLAAHVGHTLAHGATLNAGLGDFPFSKTFISHSLLQTLQKFDERRNAPARVLNPGRWHENRS